MMNKETAHVILDRAHAAWSGGDVQGVLDCYADDFIYWCNTGGPNGTPLTITGRAAMAAFLSPVVEVAESMSVVDSFEYQAPIGRAQVSCFIRHKLTGMF
jgi:hypothetical protein